MLNKITKEMGSLREQFKKFEQPHEAYDDTLQEELREANKSLSYLSEDYDAFQVFRQDATKQIDRLGKWLGTLSAKVDERAGVIWELQDYSFQYNVKITGVPETKPFESALDTRLYASTCFIKWKSTLRFGRLILPTEFPHGTRRNLSRLFASFCEN